MNGSNGETGRRPQANWRRGAQSTEDEGRGPGSSGCFLCRRSRGTAYCEQRLRIWDHLERNQPWRNRSQIPRPAALCKDCCIAALDGHHCEWWDLCWRG